jgi:branched-chain amino acid transport system ATP-binding protein
VPDPATAAEATDGVALLDARAISKRFGGVQALHDVTLSVKAGEIFGMVGPNGAGKTTLFNCLCGQLRPDGGSVNFNGECIDKLPTYRRARLGIGRTFQRIEVFPELTVRDHLLVAARAQRADGALWKDLLNLGQPKPEEVETVERVLDMVRLQDVADVPVAALSLGHCRLVELGRALAGKPRILMADEPSSGLDVQETRALADTLRHVQEEHGTAVILVEHDLDMVAQVVDRVIVLDFGQQIAAGTLDEVMADPAVRKAYLGKTA